jgi:hypothetical protein
MTTEPPVTGDPEATPEDVAALLTARTKDTQGRELGVFTDDGQTRPTREQVQTRIDIARALIRQSTGPWPDACVEGGESTVALLAAMLTEAAFWPEQTQPNQSTYERLRELYLQAREGLQACVLTWGADQTAFELNVGGDPFVCWPPDWWQRNLDNALAYADARWVEACRAS